MKLTVIGSSGSMSGPESAASCYLLQAEGLDPLTGDERTWSVAIDMGPGAFGQLWRYLDPKDLDAVLISHGHPDHLSDTISLLVFLKWNPDGPLPAMRVFGPQDIPGRIAQIEGYNGGVVESEFFHFSTAKPGAHFDVGPLHVTAFEGHHTVESYGFRIEGPSSVELGTTTTFAYTGDTDLCEPIVEMARDVDLLLTECAFINDTEVRGVHLTGARAGQLAKTSGAKHTVLTHIQPWTDPAIPVREVTEVLGDVPEVAFPGRTWLF